VTDQFYGVAGTVQDGVFFTEAIIPGAIAVTPVAVEISRQNANLFQVKSEMAQRARAAGASVIMGFRYGQRAHRGLALLKLKWDSESWHGEGVAVQVPPPPPQA
jgi:hypothetical protein